ncbi:MAG: hypothetical protein M3336_05775, partial [Chloroflexota bacterium]|nr:hypothetical protein [Chloroflexota bacterium]
MTDFMRRFIREPGAEDAPHYAARVRRLSVWYVGLFVLSVIGVVVLVWRAQLFVTLSQRSNVETLTLAFLLVFFLYLAVISAPGLWGVLHIVRLSIGGDQAAQQQRKNERLRRGDRSSTIVQLNVIVEREDQPGVPVEVEVGDRHGRMGRLRMEGARLSYLPDLRDGSNEILAYAESQLNKLLRRRGDQTEVDIVYWKKIDDDASQRWHAMVEFARNLEGQLGKGDLWPKVRLTANDLA